jgi:hypothetical protein
MPRSGWLIAMCMLIPVVAHARKAGLAGASGQGDETCNTCHSGGPVPKVQLSGPLSISAGSTVAYRLIIDGGAATVGGMGVSVDDPGARLMPDDSRTRVVAGTQLVHNAPIEFENGELRFDFTLVAPDHATSLTLYAAGNSCNGDDERTGDAAATASLTVTITDDGSRALDQAAPPVPTGCSFSTMPASLSLWPLGWLGLAWRSRRRRS